jgi:coatomer subunit beta
VEAEEKHVAPDEGIVFRQLLQRTTGADIIDDDDDFKIALASSSNSDSDGSLFSKRLAKVQQMTGLADPVYVEAFLQVHSFDLVLELLMVNRTNDVLNNVLVELSTQGDLKLVDRPVGVTLQPGQQMMVHASIKVGSTETGIIFGYVTYEHKPPEKSVAEKQAERQSRSIMDNMDGPPSGDTPKSSGMSAKMTKLVKRFKQITGPGNEAKYEAVWEEIAQESTVLSELHVDILDYIERAWIGELAFRTMWSEFEWENKININTSITEVGSFLEHIMLNTKMSIVGRSSKSLKSKKKSEKVTAEDVAEMMREAVGIQKLVETSSFVAVNLYAKSIFGEDALSNISIEKLPDGKLTGSVRIRSRTQGIALSLGDRITIVQRGVTAANKTKV